MKIVGITGGIGSGKTTVCKIFETLGVPVFYADQEAKELYHLPEIKAKVISLLGKKVLDKHNKIDRKQLAKIIFNDKQSLATINQIIHPEVRKRFIAWAKLQKGIPFVIMEAAIMIESGAHKSIDYLISVISDKKLIINRVIERDNIDLQSIKSRMSKQVSDSVRRKYSDFIILNDNKHSLIQQVLSVYKKVKGKK